MVVYKSYVFVSGLPREINAYEMVFEGLKGRDL
jgi:hypothetical protein